MSQTQLMRQVPVSHTLSLLHDFMEVHAVYTQTSFLQHATCISHIHSYTQTLNVLFNQTSFPGSHQTGQPRTNFVD